MDHVTGAQASACVGGNQARNLLGPLFREADICVAFTGHRLPDVVLSMRLCLAFWGDLSQAG